MDERFFRIALAQADGVGPVTYRKILCQLRVDGKTMHELFEADAGFLTAEMSLKDRVIKGILKVRESLGAIREMTEVLMEREILPLLEEDDLYPRRLCDAFGDWAPPVVYCWGNCELLREASVGIVGSREPDEESLTLARRAARASVRAQRVIVSGCARGVDSAAQMEALDTGGATIGVLAQGLLTRGFSGFAETISDPASCLLLSEFPPYKGWNAGSALARNRTICALSDAVLVVQAAGRGGSLECGLAALRMHKPTLTIEPLDAHAPRWSGNERLINEGAFPL
ncbi:MAG TPA: DNA-processing protein DprA, partial [bacterium]|nr:DNA-processing protein DprA [bacterium]